MNAKLLMSEIHGRTMLPNGIIFLWFAATPIFMLFPGGAHLLSSMGTQSYSWMWVVPLASGAYLGASILILERKN